MPFVECVSAACAEASGQKKWTLAYDKATAHWAEQRTLRTLRDLRDQLSLTKLCAQSVVGGCLCAECKEFRKKIPSGEPILSQLVELPEAKPEDDQSTLCTFKVDRAEGSEGREFDWDGEDEGQGTEYLPEEISIELFLLRKMDGKRLQLTADAPAPLDLRYRGDDWDDSLEFGDSHFGWNLSTKGSEGPQFAHSVCFGAQIAWRDAKELAQPPDEMEDEDEIQEWWANNPSHEPELLLSSMKVYLRDDVGNGCQCDECRWQRGRDALPPLEDVDVLLAMLRTPTFESRWL